MNPGSGGSVHVKVAIAIGRNGAHSVNGSDSGRCTSIRIKTVDGLTFEGGIDYQSGLAVIPKGTVYQGTLPDNTSKGLRWTAKYGFVGMTAFGQPLLSDGINEMGLAVGNLLFPGYADYEPFEPRKADITLSNFEVAA